MTSTSHSRQILFFLAAVLLPCSVLVFLGLRMIAQERELGEKRLRDEQRRVAGAIRQELLTQLERIKLQEISALAAQAKSSQKTTYENPAVLLVGRVESNRLVLPWEWNRPEEAAGGVLRQPGFALKVREGERAELVGNQYEKAAALYRQAMNAARHPIQAGYARLLMARTREKSGKQDEAIAQYRKILALSSDVIDDQGIPLSLYAAARLLRAGADQQAVLDRLRSEAQVLRSSPPAEAYMLRGLINSLIDSAPNAAVRAQAGELQGKILGHIHFLEQALALQRDFPSLGLARSEASAPANNQPLWVPYGQETWLVSVAPPLGALPTMVVAVRADEVFASLEPVGARADASVGQAELVAGGESSGEPLGASFPGLKVRFAATDSTALAQQWNLQRSFYLVTLLLVLSVTLFAAYLLWRDVRRELRLAELRTQFVSSVSHELKTPLTAIRMFAETLGMGRAASPQMQAEYLETIVSETQRLTRLLNNVLDFSKIEQGKKIYKFEPVCLAEVVQAAARAMQYPLAQQGFELRVEIEDGLPAARADADAIEQAILNLLTNAMKYSGESREIDLRLRRQDGRAVIQVTDRGVGIPPKEQRRIFEKFYRVVTVENQRVPGTGLGLTLVEHIAKAHGGRVEVQSEPGKGSTFSIHLPLEGAA
jgi:signal transduction histidine kinase